MRSFKGEYAHFIFNKCSSAKVSTNSQETGNSVYIYLKSRKLNTYFVHVSLL